VGHSASSLATLLIFKLLSSYYCNISDKHKLLDFCTCLCYYKEMAIESLPQNNVPPLPSPLGFLRIFMDSGYTPTHRASVNDQPDIQNSPVNTPCQLYLDQALTRLDAAQRPNRRGSLISEVIKRQDAQRAIKNNYPIPQHRLA